MTEPALPAAAAKATRREWIGLATIALPCLVYSMDLTVLNLALPALSAELRPSASQLLWIVDIYGFFVAGFLITMGTLGDRIGRRRLLLIGSALFAAASTVAAFADDAPTLIAMRALLGVAGATLAPSTLSLIRNMFHDEHERTLAIGVWITAFSVGAAIGPLVGGVLLEFHSWNAVFLVGVPPMLLALVLGPRLLPEYKDPNAGSIDAASVALSLGAVLAGVYAGKRAAEHGVDGTAAALLAVAAALGGVFVRRQRHLAYPLLDLSLFAQPRFRATVAAYALSSLAMFGVYIFVTQTLQLVLGLSPLAAGAATVPWALGFIAGSLAAPRLARRWPKMGILVVGQLVGAAGFVVLAFADGPHALAIIVAATVVMSLGLAPVFTIGNEIILTAAPPERTGAASALSETSSELSGALGIAVLGSVGTMWYRQRLAEGLAGAPDGLGAAALGGDDAATLGSAVALAETLPAPARDALLDAARGAFTDALQLASVLGAACVAVATVVSVRVWRDEQRAGGPAATVGDRE